MKYRFAKCCVSEGAHLPHRFLGQQQIDCEGDLLRSGSFAASYGIGAALRTPTHPSRAQTSAS